MSITTVLDEHFQELLALCALRSAASRNADWFLAGIAELDRRIASHVDGLLSSAELSQSLLEEQLGGDDPDAVFAAAYVLLRLQTESAAGCVLRAFQTAPPELHVAYVEALALAPFELAGAQVKQIYDSEPAGTASSAAEILARRAQLSASAHRIDEFLRHDDPLVRRTAWRIVALRDPHVTVGRAQEQG